MTNENLKFHIESDDYFGTLATILDLMRQGLNVEANKGEIETLDRMVKDLMYLQENYKIVLKG